MLDYTSLFALAAVVREGSFERAARHLHVTPSAISQSIRLLEERMGCTLVTRTQPCQATDAGQRLCQHADHVRLLEHELNTSFPVGLMPHNSGSVSVPVAVNADSLATWFVPAAISFALRHGVFLQLAVDDEGHTAQWMHNGKVLAAVTADESPATGCSSRRLGAMRYIAAANPSFIKRYFSNGVNADALALAPSLRFSTKDELQQRWVQRVCTYFVELPHHIIPSPQAFEAATLGGMGWAMHPRMLIETHLKQGNLIELLPDTALDVPLYWQQSKIASKVLNHLGQAVLEAASTSLNP